MRDVLRQLITTGREIAWGIHAGHAIRHGVPVPDRVRARAPATLTTASRDPARSGGGSPTRPTSYPAGPGVPATAACSAVT